MAKFVLTVTLNPAVDKIIYVDRFSTGDDFRASKILLSAGGKGINVSRALNHLRIKNIATGFLGGVNGELIKKKLKEEKIQNSFVEIGSQTRTNLTIVDRRNKITRVLEPGAAVSKQALKIFKNRFDTLLNQCDIVVFSGSLSPGLSDSVYAELIEAARRKNVKVILDTSGKPLRLGLRAEPFAIKPNLKEAQALLKSKLNSLNQIKAAVEYLLEMAKIVIFSLAEKGIVVGYRDKVLLAKAPKLNCLNNVGCGDSLIAGFIYALRKGFSFKKGVSFATAVGSANVLTSIPGEIYKKDINRILTQVKLKEL
jgi:1-phosphofructokinase family hexose kinase